MDPGNHPQLIIPTDREGKLGTNTHKGWKHTENSKPNPNFITGPLTACTHIMNIYPMPECPQNVEMASLLMLKAFVHTIID